MTFLTRTLQVFFVSLLTLNVGSLRAELTVKTDSDTGQWLVMENDKPVLQYNYSTIQVPKGYLERQTTGQQYAVPRSNYLHPLFDLDGKPITFDWPDNHPHHRGMYWGWPETGYKGELADLHALQGVFARPNGKIETRTENGNLVLQAENLWKWKDSESIVHETAVITVHPLGKDGRKINLELRFKGLVEEVTLARRDTELYGGLNLRMEFLKALQSGVYQDAETDTTLPAAWVFGTWDDETTGKKMELTIFERTDNPDYPGEYIHYAHVNWFQPAFPKRGTRYSLKKDETLVLRYQLWIHEATHDDAAKKEAWKEFQTVH